jgi:indolepyruvate ferredoxin oxidoreductase, beta subunit
LLSPESNAAVNEAAPIRLRPISFEKPLSIAILAMGGQGGGVLADWIVEVAEHEGWAAQSTSVPGVAQRTGATIYYIETLPPRNGVPPVFSLMPTPGDVDVVIAAELMEAGRSVLRGLVTPDKTTLITSTHRAYAVVEKEKPGDGAGDPFAVVDALDFSARRTIAFDMEKLAAERGTVISAAMLGALAGSGALPFERPAYEHIVRKGARGASASLAAFADAYDRAGKGEREAPNAGPAKRLDDLPKDAGHPELNRLVGRLRAELPESSRRFAFAGLRRIVDFQDVAYGDEYIDQLAKLAAHDAGNGGAERNFGFTSEAAKRLAVAMAYDDVIRVADIKLRPARFARLRGEAGAAPDQLVYVTEYLHPRGEEICGMLPASLGALIEARPLLFRTLDRLVNRGRRVPVGRISGFLQLYCVAALRPTRRSSLRHKRETEHREAWLAQAAKVLKQNYDLAIEILRCQRLVKGYSDTHARGLSKFDRAMAKAAKLAPREDGAQWMARLIAAALMDERGEALDGVAKTIDTL